MQTLVIGGPKHGELVDWPTKNGYWVIPGLESSKIHADETLSAIVRMHKHHYRLETIGFFGFKGSIWLSEEHSYAITQKEMGKLLLPEILSYKGAMVFNYSGVFNEH